jgi:hypothetical protein
MRRMGRGRGRGRQGGWVILDLYLFMCLGGIEDQYDSIAWPNLFKYPLFLALSLKTCILISNLAQKKPSPNIHFKYYLPSALFF